MDSQQVEVIGRNIIINQLTRAGIEVATPVRDRGIDLVAYLSKEEGATRFRARPIQLKIASDRDLSIYRKYEAFNDMVVVYVWRIAFDQDAEVYAVTTDEALQIAEQRGWTQTNTWKDSGRYNDTGVTGPSQEAIAPYRIHPDGWREKLFPTEAM